eukprot:TRINITY_DN7948_c0_g4_i1.p1 TRINITY_DN7948_c0_g4~~TRINITY_DN7948_c0_g4_i1.p1  ORF type:complete len:237 (+),score=62.80 TRINITY_DN7948_c0_g4_i1:85-711(+)
MELDAPEPSAPRAPPPAPPPSPVGCPVSPRCGALGHLRTLEHPAGNRAHRHAPLHLRLGALTLDGRRDAAGKRPLRRDAHGGQTARAVQRGLLCRVQHHRREQDAQDDRGDVGELQRDMAAMRIGGQDLAAYPSLKLLMQVFERNREQRHGAQQTAGPAAQPERADRSSDLSALGLVARLCGIGLDGPCDYVPKLAHPPCRRRHGASV